MREALETRPLTCKNTDIKTIAGCTASSVSSACKNTIHSSQKGFVAGRQLLQNVVDIDTSARIQAIKCQTNRKQFSFDDTIHPSSVKDLAIIALFDFFAAFPSVAHQWLFLVLHAIKAPEWVYNIVNDPYTDVHAYADVNGSLVFLFRIFGGVLQGCPMSSIIFNWCIDPLLWAFANISTIVQLGKVLACVLTTWLLSYRS